MLAVYNVWLAECLKNLSHFLKQGDTYYINIKSRFLVSYEKWEDLATLSPHSHKATEQRRAARHLRKYKLPSSPWSAPLPVVPQLCG